jgi:hypothetical protein
MPEGPTKSSVKHYWRVDHILAAIYKGPVGAVHSGSELIDRGSEFFVGWLRPNGIEDGLMVRLSGGPRPASLIVASPRRSESFATPERVKLMSGIVIHFQQALRTQNQLTTAIERRVDLATALDVFRRCVIIVGSVTVNRFAAAGSSFAATHLTLALPRRQ